MNIKKEKRLQRLLELFDIDSNWNGKGALKMSADTFISAEDLIKNNKIDNQYAIFLNEDGSILLDFFDLKNPISIEIKDKSYKLITNENEKMFLNRDEFLISLSDLINKKEEIKML